jgi:hypothetical protein
MLTGSYICGQNDRGTDYCRTVRIRNKLYLSSSLVALIFARTLVNYYNKFNINFASELESSPQTNLDLRNKTVGYGFHF